MGPWTSPRLLLCPRPPAVALGASPAGGGTAICPARRSLGLRGLLRPVAVVGAGVLLQEALGQLERVTPKRWGELRAVDPDVEHGRAAGVDGLGHGVADLLRVLDEEALGAHGAPDLGEVGARYLGSDEAVVVEVDLVALLGAPLLVVKDAGDDRQLLLDGRRDLVQAHPPRAVADDGEDGVLGPGYLGAEGGRVGEAAVTKG